MLKVSVDKCEKLLFIAVCKYAELLLYIYFINIILSAKSSIMKDNVLNSERYSEFLINIGCEVKWLQEVRYAKYGIAVTPKGAVLLREGKLLGEYAFCELDELLPNFMGV